jgi:predicted metal-dependent peptidase
VHNDIYLQSRQASKIKIAVGIDTSGSTCGDRSKFLGELHSLVKSFGLFDLHIIECDAEVGAYKHYTQDDNLENDIDNGEYAMTGGGGTAMRPIFDYILDNQIECDAICIMTDGYIDSIPTNPIPSLPVLWVITKNGTEDFCDWGQKIKLKQDDDDFGD